MYKICKSLLFPVVILCFSTTGLAQSNPLMDAMFREIQRGMDSLRIEKMLPPGFISYSITDANTLHIEAILGGIVKSQERPVRSFENRVLVGENGKTNENYLDFNTLWSWNQFSNEIPFSSSSNDIRRALWLQTDNSYKNAVTTYEAKISALNQQSLTEEEKQLYDFSAEPKLTMNVPYQSFQMNKPKMETLARNLSSVFKKFPLIQKSQVTIIAYDGQVFFANSEGTSVQYPLQAACLKVVATTQAASGNVLNDHLLWFARNILELPDEKTLVRMIESMANNLSGLTQKIPVAEPYCGPVLFEGQAAAEVFIQKFFSDINGLIAVRKPVAGSEQIVNIAGDRAKENTLEAMMNKKIISRDISVEALPALNIFQNTILTGSFIADAEGVRAPDKLMLIENGVLKNLLCSRIPTLKMKQSNGHARPALTSRGIKTVTGPGVIKMTNNNPLTTVDRKRLKEMLIAAAKEEDLPYAYIVRKVISEAAGIQTEGNMSYYGETQSKPDLSKTIQVYRVNVSDGSEEMISFAQVQGLSIKSFKRLLATSSELQVYNTMLKPVNTDLNTTDYPLTGISSSFILPEGMLFQELDVVKEKQGVVKNISVVPNPILIR